MQGIVYTETVVHMAPAALVNLAPYQLVMVELPGGRRVTGRSEGDRVSIGAPVEVAAERDGVLFFRRTA
ncbi:MAG: OB-fold domain-containing protein [Bryobacteraceae bacterium]|nr:OB-fold domain-containing protein [Bryobacteraceae bacterium]